METRPLGSTGLDISSIVFGAGAVGGAVFTGEPADRVAIVRRALEAGINWIDTAPGYGNGASEENLGRILADLDSAPHLSTKVRIGAADLEDIPAAIDRSVEQSLARLGRSSVDLLQLHNRVHRERDVGGGALAVEDVLGPSGVAEALERVREAGYTRFVGFTGLGEADALHELVASGRFDTIQAYHNVLNPSASRPVPAGFSALDYRELIGAAAAQGMGVLNIRVLAAGVLGGSAARAGRSPLSPGSEAERDMERAEAVRAALAAEAGTPAQHAIRFALHTPGVSGVLVGFSTRAQVDEAVEATSLPPLSDDALGALRRLWDTDFAAGA